MGLVDRAFSGFSRGASNVRRFATTSNANKALNSLNGALKSLGTQAVGAKNWYDRAVSNNVIPQTEIGNNIANVVSTIGKLN